MNHDLTADLRASQQLKRLRHYFLSLLAWLGLILLASLVVCGACALAYDWSLIWFPVAVLLFALVIFWGVWGLAYLLYPRS